jgi:glycosyltransferase involved in cell wall biosynthesis
MNIVLINHYAGSIYHGMEFRPYYLAKEWIKAGHDAVIVAASFSHLRQKNAEMDGADIKEEKIDGVRYIWIDTPKYSGNGFGRIKNMLTFIRKLYKYLPQITAEFKPDAVVASSTYPLDSYPARKFAKLHGAMFVFELHDLWPMSPQVLGNMSKYHPFIVIMQMAEDYWCRNADAVISLLPDADKHLLTRGMKREKYYVVPNGVDLAEWTEEAEPLPKEHGDLIESLKSRGKFTVGYIGGHGVSNGLDAMIELAERFKDDEGVHFILAGKGPEKGRLQETVKEKGLANVSFLPPVPKRAVPSLLRPMDALYCYSLRTPLNQYGMSLNKIFDYMMSGRPVLWAGEFSNDIVTESRCGFTVPPERQDLMELRLKELRSMSAESLAEMGERGRDYIMKNHTYPVLAERFTDALKGDKR